MSSSFVLSLPSKYKIYKDISKQTRELFCFQHSRGRLCKASEGCPFCCWDWEWIQWDTAEAGHCAQRVVHFSAGGARGRGLASQLNYAIIITKIILSSEKYYKAFTQK